MELLKNKQVCKFEKNEKIKKICIKYIISDFLIFYFYEIL